jgi:hypothetical protein
VYLVKRVNKKSVTFVTPGQNKQEVNVKQENLWQTEPVDMDNIPQEKPVTAEEKERFSEAKENNIDISATIDSSSQKTISSRLAGRPYRWTTNTAFALGYLINASSRYLGLIFHVS